MALPPVAGHESGQTGPPRPGRIAPKFRPRWSTESFEVLTDQLFRCRCGKLRAGCGRAMPAPDRASTKLRRVLHKEIFDSSVDKKNFGGTRELFRHSGGMEKVLEAM